jgi:hypothetical protein
MQNWIDIGGAEELSAAPLRRIMSDQKCSLKSVILTPLKYRQPVKRIGLGRGRFRGRANSVADRGEAAGQKPLMSRIVAARLRDRISQACEFRSATIADAARVLRPVRRFREREDGPRVPRLFFWRRQ